MSNFKSETERLERRILQLVEELGQLKDSLEYSEQKWRRARDQVNELERQLKPFGGDEY